jgi:multicomponent Na+:H+ antiporter subunit A
VFGDVHLSTTLSFDAGVYLVVVGLVLMIFEAFGDEGIDELSGGTDTGGSVS